MAGIVGDSGSDGGGDDDFVGAPGTRAAAVHGRGGLKTRRVVTPADGVARHRVEGRAESPAQEPVDDPDRILKKPTTNSGSTYRFGDVDVRFPHDAYAGQVEMMRAVVAALSGGRHALLESPTGTGKSLALLCGALGWLHAQHGRGLRPRLFVCSRTHRQLAQLVGELGRTAYAPRFVVLASRAQYCVHAGVRKAGAGVNDACREAISRPPKEQCGYYARAMRLVRASDANAFDASRDVEDLVAWGRQSRTCPYFAARAAAAGADVVFAPYGYVLAPGVRDALGVELRPGDAVIVDEAHNVEDVCRDAGSFEAGESGLAEAAAQLASIVADQDALRAGRRMKRPAGALGEAELAAVRAQAHVLGVLGAWLRRGALASPRAAVRGDFEARTLVWAAGALADELRALGLGREAVLQHAASLKRLLRPDRASRSADADEKPSGGDAGDALAAVSSGTTEMLRGLYHALCGALGDDARAYRLVRWEAPVRDGRGRRMAATLGVWCLSPGAVFRSLASAVSSVVLASGTLAPLDALAAELGADFAVRLEAPHVVAEAQVFAAAAAAGPLRVPLLGVYRNAASLPYQDDVGAALVGLASVVPAGLLVFLPSYAFLAALVRRMAATGALAALRAHKTLFAEPQRGDPADFEAAMAAYCAAVALPPAGDAHLAAVLGGDALGTEASPDPAAVPHLSPLVPPARPPRGGALLFAVYRGKVSEGIDLRDDHCRAVACVGVPFPALRDPRVVLKREYNDALARGSATTGAAALSGGAWYECQAFRALSQALGRCIRHVRDWGAVVLLDARPAAGRNRASLPRWVRGALAEHADFGALLGQLAAFVRRNAGGGAGDEGGGVFSGAEEPSAKNEPALLGQPNAKRMPDRDAAHVSDAQCAGAPGAKASKVSPAVNGIPSGSAAAAVTTVDSSSDDEILGAPGRAAPAPHTDAHEPGSSQWDPIDLSGLSDFDVQ